jgi:uroporphyrinogen decarboxylase
MLFLDALHCKNSIHRPPVWLMRQAGRYMHEYQALRKKYDLLTLFQTPELIAEVTLMPIEAFGFDAAIIFSDILLIAEAFGQKLCYVEGRGPQLSPLVSLKELKYPQEDFLDYVIEGIFLVKPALHVPLIGFAGAPFTVAAYMIEGGSSQNLAKTKKWFYEDQKSFLQLLDVLTESTITYLKKQIRAGCDCLQIFDSLAFMLPEEAFELCCLKSIEKIIQELGNQIPVIVFCRNSSLFAEKIADLKAKAISVDWQSDISSIRKRVGPSIALQGNLDPDILLTNPNIVARETKRLMQKMKNDPGFIVNLGHGILPSTPRENVQALVDCVRGNDGF